MNNNFINFFEKTVKKFPLKLAIIDNGKKINFRDLKKNSQILATQIQKNLKKYDSCLIAIYLEKSIELISSNLATTYSGNFYINIDPDNPLQKNIIILKKLEPKIIIINKKNFKKLNAKTKNEFKFLIYENLIKKKKNIIYNKVEFNFKKRINTDPYCVINTSGSTGTPKGVILNHNNFFDFMNWTKYEFNFNNRIIIGSLSPSVFDIFNFEVCMMAFNSSTIVIIPKKYIAFPYEILKLLKSNNVNFIFWVPTIMVNIANLKLLEKINLTKLKHVWFAGEVFPARQLLYWLKKMKKTSFTNLYGPIEITLDCIFFKIKKNISANEKIPIGYPCKNTDIILLNKKNNNCDFLEEGEICVRGASLAMGYYNDFETTKKKFIQNPLNKKYPELIYKTGDFAYKNKKNQIIFIGRKDNQIKHFGYRIELSEIENLSFKAIKEIKNVCVEYNSEEKKIVMFYESHSKIDESILHNKLNKILPKYMMPVNFFYEKIIKMNVNGKIDRLYYKKKINKLL